MRNPKIDGKKKGGLKVHMLIDAVQSVGKFMKITAAKMHDKNFLCEIQVPHHSMLFLIRPITSKNSSMSGRKRKSTLLRVKKYCCFKSKMCKSIE